MVRCNLVALMIIIYCMYPCNVHLHIWRELSLCVLAVLLATVLLCISLFHYVEKPTGQHWWGYLKYIALAAIALGLPSICLKAFGSLRNWVGSHI